MATINAPAASHHAHTHVAIHAKIAKWKSGWTANAIKDPVNMIDMTEKTNLYMVM